MLKEVAYETTAVMSEIVQLTDSVVTTMTDLSQSFEQIDQLMSDSSGASDKISDTFRKQNSAANEISASVVNLYNFLTSKSKETQQLSLQASSLSMSTESIFVELSELGSKTVITSMCKQVQLTANRVGQFFENSITDETITMPELFNFNYQPISNTVPQKFTTSFDSFTDRCLPKIQETPVEEFKGMIYEIAIDLRGYVPTHNNCYSRHLTGNQEIDVANSRSKRIYDDVTCIHYCKNTDKFLLQTYKRDTGEILHDVSASIVVRGKHWGI